MPASLRAQILAWMVAPLAVVVAAAIVLDLGNAAKTAGVVNDRLLLGSARMIGQHVGMEDGELRVAIPPAALELFQSGAADDVFYRVAAADGRLIAGYADLPAPPVTPEPDEAAYYDASVRGNAVRAVTYAQPLFGAHEDRVLVQVAHTLHSRERLARGIAMQGVWQQLTLVALAAVLVIVGLRRALRPLRRLGAEVRSREPGALEPLEARGVPTELRPLVDGLNDYVRRLQAHVRAHERFIGNAAHQLRTPLAVLNTQVDYALRAEAGEAREALRSMRESLAHSKRAVSQLLTLSRAEAGAIRGADRGGDVGEVVHEVLEDLAPMAHAKRIDLGFEGEAQGARVGVDRGMLHELVANLVDNALRYTPAGGAVTAAVRRLGDAVQLRVEDNGPGIPAAERERVFERFYRLQHDLSDGCGLGLAIVREIAAAHHARVELGDRAEGPGLVATVTFAYRAVDTNSVV